MTVTVRQIDKLNTLLDGALKAGLNEIRSVSPGVSQPQRYQQQARDEAIKDAISQASALAKGFNTRLGPVWSIQYHTEDTSARPVMRMYSLAKANADTTPQQTYEQQSISFDDNVNVVFELFPPSKPAVTPVAEPENQP
ncbi:oxidative stress defense protein [Tatumella ptyseos]|uniref:Oxidative stress defense protein n=1 Tax=Tatumella ptyseos TaxID=82987 RepID=A0A2X5NGE8_9GAMM|nr:oxidative stress defense protein [Tatumella ptyseos]